jgi:hypothetical protein
VTSAETVTRLGRIVREAVALDDAQFYVDVGVAVRRIAGLDPSESPQDPRCAHRFLIDAIDEAEAHLLGHPKRPRFH